MGYCFTCEKVVDGNKLSTGDIQCTICRGMFVVEQTPDEAERRVEQHRSAHARTTAIHCVRGHTLNEQRLHATRWCDVCNEKLITGTFVLSCVPCDYDLCAECESRNARARPRHNVAVSTIGANAAAIVPGIMLGMNSMMHGFAAAFELRDDAGDGQSEEDSILARVTRGIGRSLDVLMETEGLNEHDLNLLANMRQNFQEGMNPGGGMRGWIGHLVSFMEEQLGGHWEEEASGLTEEMLDEHLQQCIADAPKAKSDEGEWICPICTEPAVDVTDYPFPVRGRKRKSSRRASDQSSSPQDDGGRVSAARRRPAPVDASEKTVMHEECSSPSVGGSASRKCVQPGMPESCSAPSTAQVAGDAGKSPVATSFTGTSLGASHHVAANAAAIAVSPPAKAASAQSQPVEETRALPRIGGFIVQIACGHYFHFSCLREWLKRKDACPMCRRQPIVGLSQTSDEDEV